MEKYIWSGIADNVNLIFTLIIGEEQSRFNKEGLLQDIQILIKNQKGECELYHTTFGCQEAIRVWDIPNNSNCNSSQDKLITELKNWLLICLSKSRQRKDKIDKIKNKIKYAIV